jgi:hypothetical protein
MRTTRTVAASERPTRLDAESMVEHGLEVGLRLRVVL